MQTLQSRGVAGENKDVVGVGPETVCVSHPGTELVCIWSTPCEAEFSVMVQFILVF